MELYKINIRVRLSHTLSISMTTSSFELKYQINNVIYSSDAASISRLADKIHQILRENPIGARIIIPPQSGWSIVKHNGKNKEFHYPGLKFCKPQMDNWLVVSNGKVHQSTSFESLVDLADPAQNQIKYSIYNEPKIEGFENQVRNQKLQEKYGVVLSDLPSVGPDHEPKYLTTPNHLAAMVLSHPSLKDEFDAWYSTFTRKCNFAIKNQTVSGETIAVKLTKPLIKIWKDKEIPKTKVLDALDVICYQNTRDELFQWFAQLKWDGKPRLDTWLIDYLGAEDCPIVRVMGRRWLISGAARALSVDTPSGYEGVLLLVGAKGLGKSQTFRLLSPFPEWFSDSHLDISDNKKVSEIITGKFIHETAELAAWTKRENEQIKSFVTATEDDFRAAYQRHPERVIRRTIFGATSNNLQVLSDLTGNRRLWVVEMKKKLDREAFRKVVPQLWAEATARYLTKETQFLTSEEQALLDTHGGNYEQVDTAVEALRTDLESHFKANDPNNRGKITSSDLHTLFERVGIKSNAKKGEAMRSLGFKLETKSIQGKVCKVWVRS